MFRFAAFGAGDTTSLRAYRQDVKGSEDNENNNDDDNSPTVIVITAIVLQYYCNNCYIIAIFKSVFYNVYIITV